MPDSSAQLRTHPDGSIRLGVVSDSHSAPHPDGLTHLEALRPDAILHAGDVGESSVLEQFSSIAPTLSVRGNIDGSSCRLPEVLAIDILDGAQPALRILLLHIGLTGPSLRPDVRRRARVARASLIVCGHSHVPFIGRDQGLSVFNPGSIGPRRFDLPIVFGVLELDRAQVRLRHIDCTTGEEWMPFR